MWLIEWAYERLTGTPWTTTRSMAAEYGPTFASRFPELSEYSDADLYAMDRADIIAKIEATRRTGR